MKTSVANRGGVSQKMVHTRYRIARMYDLCSMEPQTTDIAKDWVLLAKNIGKHCSIDET